MREGERLTARGSIRLFACIAILSATVLAGSLSLRATPADGDVGVGGNVPSILSLSITNVSSSWRAQKSKPAGYVLTVGIEATATHGGTRLSVADGDAASGRFHGRLALRSRPVNPPLLVSAGGPYASLAARLAPQLLRWPGPIASARARIRLLQRSSRPVNPAVDKLLLVTLAVAGP